MEEVIDRSLLEKKRHRLAMSCDSKGGARQRYNTSRAHAAMTLHAATCGLMHSGTTPRPELPLMQHRVHPDTRR
ncbi:hypothetical protein NG827_01840 [Xanthomonas sacchari]|uniref:hypothetical protein n=1 Tax=Xanthomonas sacchari TaxID=56458 RepID=UPI0022504F5F|nr:hypothetical protein [Xanthomonas sacchari]UYK85186.1 hypothetical protein NG827_01840 [Xanthomonas sacchari]